MIRDDIAWQTNSTLTYPGAGDGRARQYREDWAGLKLVLTDYQASSTVMGLEAAYSLKDFEGDDWKPLTADARKRYLELRVGEVSQVADPFRFRIHGTAKIDRRDTVNVVHITNSPFERRASYSVPGFKARFDKVEVTIVGGDEDKRGILRFNEESEFGPDHLSFEVMVHIDKLKRIISHIGTREEPPVLDVFVNALLFADESRGAHFDLPDDFVLPADPGSALAILTGVSIDWGKRTARADPFDSDVGEPEAVRDPQVETNKLLRSIKTAAWALFAIVAVFIVLYLR